jgi:transcriptional regulator with XRE-family HTH domain
MTDEENLRKILSLNIKKYRGIRRFSQEKLAEKTELSVQLIKDIEGCRSWVSDKTIIKLARTLDVEAYQLIYPQTEEARLFPVRLPSDVLRDLQKDIKASIDRHFDAAVKTE